MNAARRITLAFFCALTLSACLGGGDDEIEPARLVSFEPTLEVKRLWSASLGKNADGLRLGLSPAGDGARVYAASVAGRVVSFDALSGKRLWSTDTGVMLAAGPGVGGDLVIVGGNNGGVVALNRDDGVERWRRSIQSELLAAPAIGRDFVALRTVDGRLIALEARDGSERWNIRRRVSGLTLRGNSTPALAPGLVISGFDNGKIVAVSSTDGSVVWESTLTEKRGRTELERLADIDAGLIVTGEDVFAAGFQGNAALLSLRDGNSVWSRELSVFNNLAIDWNRVYLSLDDDSIVALNRSDGSQQWSQAALNARSVTAPAAVAQAIAVGDFEGYIHWLSASDGQFVARTRAGKGAIVGTPLAMGDAIYVQTDDGELFAFAPQ